MMKSLFLLCAIIGSISAMSASDLAKKYRELVSKYHHEPILQASPADQRAHFAAFKETAEFIEVHNAEDGEEWQADFNEFSIMTATEKAAYTGLNVSSLVMTEEEVVEMEERSLVKRADSADYRSSIPAPKNQGGCGSCWTFGATAALEYQVNKDVANSKCHMNLAEQLFLNCVYEGSRDGCNGGWPAQCYTWSKNNGNYAASTTDMPYTKVDGKCVTKVKNAIAGFKISGTAYISPKTDSAVTEAVADKSIGVLSVAIGVVNDFYNYKSGVYSGKSCSSVNHAVNIVGYGTSGKIGYFLVRNSWGDSWGDEGYIKMKRGLKSSLSTCAISDYAHYPRVTGSSDYECGGDDTNACSWNKMTQKRMRGNLTKLIYDLDEAKKLCEENEKCKGVSCNDKGKCQLNSKNGSSSKMKFTAYQCKRL